MKTLTKSNTTMIFICQRKHLVMQNSPIVLDYLLGYCKGCHLSKISRYNEILTNRNMNNDFNKRLGYHFIECMLFCHLISHSVNPFKDSL